MTPEELAEETRTGDDKIVEVAKARFQRCRDWESTAQARWQADMKFAHADPDNGWQWPGYLWSQKKDDAEGYKPRLTVNKVRQHNLHITNDQKQNKPGIHIRPVGEDATFDAAKIWEGLVRHIERISKATQAYGTAGEHQVNGGIGYIRVVTEYIEETFDQEIFIRRVKNPMNIHMDPDHNEIDGSDSSFAFVFDQIPVVEYYKKHPEMRGQATNMTFGMTPNWLGDEHVMELEYFDKVKRRDTLVLMKNPDGGDMVVARWSKIPAQIRKFIEPNDILRRRPIEDDEIKWYKIAGDHIVERGKWPGKYIPIVPIIGEETIIENQLDRKGHTRALKDAQRMYNFWTALSLTTTLPTPTGWTTMGQVQTGDWLLDENGLPVQVAGLSPVHLMHKCFLIRFSDDTQIVADAGHLWKVEEKRKRKAGSTAWSTKTVRTDELRPGTHFIYATKPLELPAQELPIDPYVLGVWLGNGSAANGQISIGSSDTGEIRANLMARGYRTGEPAPAGSGRQATVMTIYDLHPVLRRIGLLGNKHVPAIYLRASREQRLELLRGLMDTDGYCSMEGRCEFSSVNDAIADGVSELLRSLGIRAKEFKKPSQSRLFSNGQTYECQGSRVSSFAVEPTMNVFCLSRKLDRQARQRNDYSRRTKRHEIVSVTEVPSVPVRCVALNSASHLYLAGEGMVPTHNSNAVEQVALQTKSRWFVPVGATDNLDQYYRMFNRQNYPLIPWNAFDADGNQLPSPIAIEPPTMADAYIKGMMISQNELMMASGQREENMGEQTNAISGKAIDARQRQGDNATYHYIDGLAIGVRQVGNIILDVAPHIYTSRQIKMILAEDGSEQLIRIDPSADVGYAESKEDEQTWVVFNPKVGRYWVDSDIGPSYATKRQEAWNAFVQITTANQQLVGVIGDLMFRNADFPGAAEIAERLKRMVPPNILGEGPEPALVQAQQQNQSLQSLLAEMTEKLAKQELQLQDKEGKLLVDQQNADTARLREIGNAEGNLGEERLMPLIQKLIADALAEVKPSAAGEPGAEENATAAQAAASPPAAPNGAGGPPVPGGPENAPTAAPAAAPAGGAGPSGEVPPVHGARRAPDGNHYVPDTRRPGKYLRVEQG